MFSASLEFDLTEEFRQSAEFRQVHDFVLESDQAINNETFNNAPDTVPFNYDVFRRFCNMMITAHRSSIVRHDGGITLVGDGLQLSTIRGQKSMTYHLQKATLEL